jgi:hypothetical protein
MPYFSNKTTDSAVDGHAREGGRLLALALRDIYDVIADLEAGETLAFDTLMGRMSDRLQASLVVYARAEGAASPDPVNLGEVPAIELRRLEPLLDAAERSGIRAEAFSDRDMFLLTRAGISLLLNLVDDARGREATDFAIIDGILRAAMRLQTVSLACTRLLSQLYRGDYRYA